MRVEFYISIMPVLSVLDGPKKFMLKADKEKGNFEKA